LLQAQAVFARIFNKIKYDGYFPTRTSVPIKACLEAIDFGLGGSQFGLS
jgi:hypothetical protein